MPDARLRPIVTRDVDPNVELGPEIAPLLARIFAARGIKRADELDLSLTGLLPPTGLVDVELAGEILARAVRERRHVKVVADFDADGATACALAVSALRAMGTDRVSFLVPNRFDFGYGLSREIVALALQDRPDVLVTVDNGVASIEGVAAAKAGGVEVIVTDHHLPGKQLPAADALVDPNVPGDTFPSKALAGVGVIFYVMSATRSALRSTGWFESQHIDEPVLGDWLDLVALGTIADVVPLDRNNRILVQQGLRRIRAGRTRPGIRALCEASGRDMSELKASDLGFALGPRLNAAGRLDDMSIGIRCLLAADLAEARSLATALEQLNRARREIEQQMTQQAELIVSGIDDAEETLGLCVYDPHWHQGVVGIVAGRLRERFHRPAIAFADSGPAAPEEIKGSARSIPGVHIRDALDAIATRYPGLVSKFGGHAMAAGLTIRRIHFERFARAFAAEIARWVTSDELKGTLVTDGGLEVEDLVLERAAEIDAAGPWGQGFPEPCFHGAFEVLHQRTVGERHTRLTLRTNERVVDAIAFNTSQLEATDRVTVVYRLSVNDWGDRRTLQLVVEHIEPIESC